MIVSQAYAISVIKTGSGQCGISAENGNTYNASFNYGMDCGDGYPGYEVGSPCELDSTDNCAGSCNYNFECVYTGGVDGASCSGAGSTDVTMNCLPCASYAPCCPSPVSDTVPI